MMNRPAVATAAAAVAVAAAVVAVAAAAVAVAAAAVAEALHRTSRRRSKGGLQHKRHRQS